MRVSPRPWRRAALVLSMIAPLSLTSATALAGTPRYDCDDADDCAPPCVLDAGECYQPIECPLLTESDPAYDGCSLPDLLIAADVFLNPMQAVLFASWRERFGTSSDDSSPCLRHDQCYLMGALTYGASQHECDVQFRDDMIAQCESQIPAWNFLARTSCVRMATLFYAGVVAGGKPRYDEKQTVCCDYASDPDALSAVCAAAYAHAPEADGPPPIPESCVGHEGQCPGAECVPVDTFGADYADLIDPWSAFHPNGDFGAGWRCDVDVVMDEGSRLVCNEVGGVGRCQACGTDTTLGCPCSEDDDCAAGQSCRGGASEGWIGGAGRCWAIGAMPDWQCAEPCEVLSDILGNEAYYCEHTLPGAAACAPADHGTVAVLTCAPLVPSAWDECAAQCLGEADCTSHGWPDGVSCHDGRCQL